MPRFGDQRAEEAPKFSGLSGHVIVTRNDKPKKQKKIFIICPVRNVKPEVNEKIAAYAAKLEAEGHEVYWPHRDNPYQEADKIGRTIIGLNREKMIEADEIHIWYDKGSTGSIFDIGMFFALVRAQGFKKFVIINREDVVSTPHKSFENVLWELEKEYSKEEYYR